MFWTSLLCTIAKKMHFGIKNKIGANIRRTSIARLTGMTKQARGRELTSNQRRPFKNILNLTGDIYQGYWSCSHLSLDDIKCEGLMQRHSSEFEVLKG